MGFNEDRDSGSLIRIRYDDESTPATQSKLGSNDKPDFDYTNFGLLFPQNDTSEYVVLMRQMKHAKALDTPIHLHVHFIQSSALLPVFTCEYRWYTNGSTVPTFSTVSTNSDGGTTSVFPYTSGNLLQICAFPWIAPPVDETISSHFEAKIYRNDNIVTGDVLVKYIDIHVAKDTDGSRYEFIK